MKKEKKPKTKTVKQKKVKPQKIKQKKVKAPKYIPVKPVFGTAEDYYIYRLNPVETATGALLGGIVGFFFSMVFFRNVIFSLIVGLLLVVPGIRKYRDYLKDKRMKNLLYQFRDMMESLSASYSAGKNTQGAFLDACGDMIGIYGEKADIVKELKPAAYQPAINSTDFVRNVDLAWDMGNFFLKKLGLDGKAQKLGETFDKVKNFLF